jgi:DNA-binding NarL/FixJ family response regulator
MRPSPRSRASLPQDKLSVVVSLDDRSERHLHRESVPEHEQCLLGCGLAKELAETVLSFVGRHAAEANQSDVLNGLLRGLPAPTAGVPTGAVEMRRGAESAIVRVLIVDDHELVRQGLRRMFERAGGYEIVGEVGTVAEATEILAHADVDLVLVDTLMPDGNGIGVVSEVRKRSSTIGILILATADTDEQLIGALEAGASGLVAKSATADEMLASAAQAVRMPEIFTSKQFAEVMKRRSYGTGPRLSNREREVLILLSEGLSAPDIAGRLFVAESTVKGNMAKLYAKLEATNRAQAIMAGIRHGIIWP